MNSSENYILPLFNCHKKLNWLFQDNILSNKNLTVYGSFPSKLSGGRFCKQDDFSQDNFLVDIDYFNFKGINCRLTLSNSNIIVNDLKDEFLNVVLNKLNSNNKKFNCKNGIICESLLLKKFLQETYPLLLIICSVIKVCNDTNFKTDDVFYYKSLIDNYDLVVLNPSKCHDFDFLSQFTQLEKDKIELLINTRCIKNCPFAKGHYKAVGEINQQVNINENSLKCNELYQQCRKIYFQSNDKNFCSKELVNKLKNSGFSNFKLEGRDFSDQQLLDDIKYYLF